MAKGSCDALEHHSLRLKFFGWINRSRSDKMRCRPKGQYTQYPHVKESRRNNERLEFMYFENEFSGDSLMLD